MYVAGIFLNPEIRTGGHRRYLEFFQEVAEKGHEVLLILNSKLEYKFTEVNEIRIEYNYRKKIIPYSFISMIKLIQNKDKLLSQGKGCDFVVIHGETHVLAGIYFKKKINARMLFALRSNGVVEAQMKRRESGLTQFQRIKLYLSEYKYRTYEKIASRYSDVLAFQSDFDKNSVLSRNRRIKGKAVVIPGNIGGPWFDASMRDRNSSSELRKIIFVGAITQRKGIRYLVEAFVMLHKKGLNLELVIAGKGPLTGEMQKILDSSGLSNSVQFPGKVSNPLDFIATADLMVVPSIFDSFPDVILESLYVGTPVIAADSGGMPDMLDPEDVFEAGNSEAIYNIIAERYNSKRLYEESKKRLFENRKRFSFDWAQAFIDVMIE